MANVTVALIPASADQSGALERLMLGEFAIPDRAPEGSGMLAGQVADWITLNRHLNSMLVVGVIILQR